MFTGRLEDGTGTEATKVVDVAWLPVAAPTVHTWSDGTSGCSGGLRGFRGALRRGPGLPAPDHPNVPVGHRPGSFGSGTPGPEERAAPSSG
ncbi:hypothetical protein GCM10007147_31010 [Nocardiopsis kunsanensis]|uniref:Uncharacterized protein n=1 Tax=Nocardiopsis kunsanensis TaxID=141693 RepID=A0A918XFJ5_9ACTN|nr:hypothetical protein GCM10007147_31010 [Nocardiopsis kunsanensis]